MKEKGLAENIKNEQKSHLNAAKNKSPIITGLYIEDLLNHKILAALGI